MPSRTRQVIGAAVVTLAAALTASAAAADKRHPQKQIAPVPPPPSERGLGGVHGIQGDAERASAIGRARAEIQKNPNQRKFILFRYGLNEEDLR